MHTYYNESEGLGTRFYTDLASERRRADTECDGIEYEKQSASVGEWERVRVSDEDGERSVMRPIGVYDTLNTERLDLLCEDEICDAKDEIAKRLCELCDEMGVFPGRILVVGFGNEKMTADSVGPKSAALVKPTLHISEYDPDYFDDLDCSEIAVLRPGVTAASGMDSANATRSVCERLMPDLVIAIDSIMTSSHKRLGTTIQISSTGLFPGGIGNLHSPITKASVGAPVISIGVPTVIDCRVIAPELFCDSHFFISPREIDEITNSAAEIIGGAINRTFGLYL